MPDLPKLPERENPARQRMSPAEVSRRLYYVGDPLRVRIEADQYALVVRRDRWWESSVRSDERGRSAQVVLGRLQMARVLPMLDPGWLSQLGARQDGQEDVAGRRCQRWVLPTGSGKRWIQSGWAPIADEAEAWVDAERGVVLRLQESIKGEPYQITELADVSYDQDWPDSLFRIRLSAERAFRDARDLLPIPCRDLEQARSKAAFRMPSLSIPTRLGLPKVAFVHPPGRPPCPGGAVHSLWFEGEYKARQELLAVHAEPVASEFERFDATAYEARLFEGVEVLVRSGSSNGATSDQAVRTVGGVRLTITSALGLEETSRIAASAREY